MKKLLKRMKRYYLNIEYIIYSIVDRYVDSFSIHLFIKNIFQINKKILQV